MVYIDPPAQPNSWPTTYWRTTHTQKNHKNKKRRVDTVGRISITLLPSAYVFWHIRAIQGLNRPNMPKKYRGWCQSYRDIPNLGALVILWDWRNPYREGR